MEGVNIIPHASIDLKKWDKAVLNAPFPLVFAQSFYLNATAKNWHALVMDNYKAVMPLTQASKLKINYLFQPPFTSQLGVYGDVSKKQLELIQETVVQNYKFIEVEINAGNKFSSHVKDKSTYVIEFNKGYKYNENTKRNIAKAKKAEVKVKEVNSLDGALKLAHTKLIPWLKKEHKVSQEHCKLMLKLIENAHNSRALKTFVTEDESGKQHALGYFIFNQFHCVFLKGFSFNKKDNTGSMHALIDEAIQKFNGKVELFDFGGGSSQGLATFYKGFGGKELKYQVFRVNNLPWPLNVIKK